MGVTIVEYNTHQPEIEKLIKSLDRPGDYCVHSKLVTPMPRLVVNRVGTIAFPVLESQIAALIKAAERAPYGRGPDTVLDRSVRDSWQIDRKKFRLGGAGWSGTLKTILGRVAKGLGCDSKRLEARPYKLLVYEPGGFFEPHRDTEKQVGMIGTLVVSLPTSGSGGELVVRHKGRERVIDLCGDDPGAMVFAAFYADCTHETRPVRKGHRVSLVFNLILRGSRSADAGRAPDFSSKAAELGALLRNWACDAKAGAKIVWLMDHDYSRAGLSFSTLKGTDTVAARALEAAANQAQCTFHAATLHITETGYADDYWGYNNLNDLPMEEVIDWECKLANWVAPDGSRPTYGALPLQDEELMPSGALDDADPDDKWVEEASGNEGITVEHVYRKAALVVWPKARIVQTLAAAGISKAIDYVEAKADLVREASGDRVGVMALASELIDTWDAKGKANTLHDRDGEQFRNVLSLLKRIGAADLTARFVLRNATHSYHASGNNELAVALRTVGADVAADFLPEFVRANLYEHTQSVLEFLWHLAGEHWKEGPGPWRDALGAAGAAVFKALPLVVDPPARPDLPEWRQPTPKALSEEAIGDLFSLAGRLGLDAEADNAVRLLSKHSSLASPTRAIPKALTRMRTRGAELSKSAAYRALWQTAADYLLKRSGKPPEPPRSWYIKAELGCSCKGCGQLHAFCADAQSQVAKISVARPMRDHLRAKIDVLKLDIDYATERIGRPYSLVLTKNRASYQRLLERYDDDLKHMRMLIGAAPVLGEMEHPPHQLETLRTLTNSAN